MNHKKKKNGKSIKVRTNFARREKESKYLCERKTQSNDPQILSNNRRKTIPFLEGRNMRID